MGQTSVDFAPDVAIEGMVSRTTAHQTNSRVAAEAIQNGRLVVQGTRDLQCKLPASAADVARARGISPYRATQMPSWPPGVSSSHYQAGQTVEAVARGRVWVKVEEAVAPDDPVYVRFAVHGGLDQLGAFRKSADLSGGAGTETAAQLATAKYLTTAAINGLALVDLNLP